MNLVVEMTNFVLNHAIEIVVGIISSIVFILFQSGAVNIFNWIKFTRSKYRYYIGDYYLYNYSTTGHNLIIETRLSIKQFFGKITVTAEEPNFSFDGSMVINEKNIYIKLTGKNHVEELLYIFFNPLTGQIRKLKGIVACVSALDEPCALRVLLSDTKLDESAASQELGKLDDKEQIQIFKIIKTVGVYLDNKKYPRDAFGTVLNTSAIKDKLMFTVRKIRVGKKYAPKSWNSPKVDVNPSSIHGRGMFAKSLITEGESVCVWGGHLFTRDDIVAGRVAEDSYVAINDGLYLGHHVTQGRSEDDFINHSCDPNVWMLDEVTIVAKRDIQPGEEITADYAMWWVDKDLYPPLICNCGLANCRKIITESDWMRSDLQERYSQHFSPLILRRMTQKSVI